MCFLCIEWVHTITERGVHESWECRSRARLNWGLDEAGILLSQGKDLGYYQMKTESFAREIYTWMSPTQLKCAFTSRSLIKVTLKGFSVPSCRKPLKACCEIDRNPIHPQLISQTEGSVCWRIHGSARPSRSDHQYVNLFISKFYITISRLLLHACQGSYLLFTERLLKEGWWENIKRSFGWRGVYFDHIYLLC